MEEIIKHITETIKGYKVKDLRWLPMDNIIVGMVLDGVWSNPKIHEGYVSAKWSKSGRYIKEKNRPELNLNITSFDNTIKITT